jgi:hypothetical protein
MTIFLFENNQANKYLLFIKCNHVYNLSSSLLSTNNYSLLNPIKMVLLYLFRFKQISPRNKFRL